MTTKKSVFVGVVITLAAAAIYQWGHMDGSEGKASKVITESIAESSSVPSTVKARERDYYAPNSEDLKPDEMRVIAWN